jgi:adenosylmethionine---8-amino-7-oxononanoate aminotransferase
MNRAVFITATDTEVGKTIVSGLICRGLNKKGIDCAVMKPVETGAIQRGAKWVWPDTEFLKKVSRAAEDIAQISPFRFRNPLAPSLAAKREGKAIDIKEIKSAFNNLIQRHQFVIVEGAGGLLVPLNKDFLTIDLIRELDIPVIIVSRLGLGTINHTLLTVEAARNAGIRVLGVVFNQATNKKSSICEKNNPRIISTISGVPVLGIVPYLPGVNVGKCETQGLTSAVKYINLGPILKEGEKEDSSALEKWDKKYLWHPFTQMQDWLKDEPLVISEGKGSYLKDIKGKWYLDGISSLWVNLHGHRNPALDAALRRQINKISHSTLLGLANAPSIELARRLITIGPGKLSKVFYSDNGSTAVEIALKMAFQYWQQKSGLSAKRKKRFIHFVNSYHGDTIGAVSVGGIDLFHKTYGPLLFKSFKVNSPYCYRCHLGLSYPACKLKCLDETGKILEKHHREIAGLIIEPMVYAAAGMLTQPPGFLKGIEALCRKYGVLLICDEVATGFGRTGKMFACEKEKVRPDILCLAKGITAGYLPLAATLTTEEIFEGFLGKYQEQKTFFHGHTYTGNPLACSVAIANLEIFQKEKVLQKLQDKILRMKNGLRHFNELRHVGEIRQCGFMAGIELVKDKTSKLPYDWEDRVGIKVCQEARKYGLILRPLGNVIVLMPPLSISNEELSRLLDITCRSIKIITENEGHKK